MGHGFSFVLVSGAAPLIALENPIGVDGCEAQLVAFAPLRCKNESVSRGNHVTNRTTFNIPGRAERVFRSCTKECCRRISFWLAALWSSSAAGRRSDPILLPWQSLRHLRSQPSTRVSASTTLYRRVFGGGQLDRSVTRRTLALCRAGTPGQRRYGDMEQHPEEGP